MLGDPAPAVGPLKEASVITAKAGEHAPAAQQSLHPSWKEIPVACNLRGAEDAGLISKSGLFAGPDAECDTIAPTLELALPDGEVGDADLELAKRLQGEEEERHSEKMKQELRDAAFAAQLGAEELEAMDPAPSPSACGVSGALDGSLESSDENAGGRRRSKRKRKPVRVDQFLIGEEIDEWDDYERPSRKARKKHKSAPKSDAPIRHPRSKVRPGKRPCDTPIPRPKKLPRYEAAVPAPQVPLLMPAVEVFDVPVLEPVSQALVPRHQSFEMDKVAAISHARKGEIAALEALLHSSPEVVDRVISAVMRAAISASQAASVQVCIGYGADVNRVSTDGNTPIDDAAFFGDVSVGRVLAENGANLRARIRGRGTTPLHTACSEGNVEFVEWLVLEREQDVNEVDDDGSNSLLWCLGNQVLSKDNSQKYQRRVICTRRVLEFGVDFDQPDNEGNTALLWACEYGFVEIVAELCRHGASVTHRNTQGMSALGIAKNKQSSLGNVTPADRDARRKNKAIMLLINKACLAVALENGTAATVRKHVAAGTLGRTPEDRKECFKWDKNGASTTFLHLAVECEKRGAGALCAKVLLEHDPEALEYLDDQGDTALGHACYLGRLDCVQLLVERGAAITHTNKMARSLLHLTMRVIPVSLRELMRQTSVLSYLLRDVGIVEELPDGVNVKDQDGTTVVHFAARTGNTDAMAMLLEHGADINMVDPNQWNAVHYLANPADDTDGLRVQPSAHPNSVHSLDEDGLRRLKDILNKCAEMLAFMKRQDGNLDVGAVDADGCTPLHWAAWSGNLPVMDTLLSMSESLEGIDKQNRWGNTALHYATYGTSSRSSDDAYNQCARSLLNAGASILANDRGMNAFEVVVDKSISESLLRVARRLGHTDLPRFPFAPALPSPVLPSASEPQWHDLSNGREQFPIPVFNDVDSAVLEEQLKDQEFRYQNAHVATPGVNVPLGTPQVNGCDGADCLEFSYKPRACSDGFPSPYTPDGRLDLQSLTARTQRPIYECNLMCRCDMKRCVSRLIQHGLRLPLQVFRVSEEIGWGVRCAADIAPGTFVAEYLGEVITSKLADELGKQSSLRTSYFYQLVKDDMDDNSFIIDAHRFGSISRFFNHSCDGNLLAKLVFVDHHDKSYPRVCFFANQHIPAYSQLTYDYGYAPFPHPHVIFNCKCGADHCRQRLL